MNFSFLLDENMDYAVIDYLESKGFTVEHIKKIDKTGIKNGKVYQYAEEKQMWIITRDKDYQNLYRSSKSKETGIVYLKIKNTKRKFIINALDRLFSENVDFYTKKQLIIIDDERIEFIE